jgi:DNA-binding transcriptional regulator GbsR (MarR family)
MTNYAEHLEMRLRSNPDKPVSLFEVGEELGLSREAVQTNIQRLARRQYIFDLGNGRMMYTTNSDVSAFELFRTVAPRISLEEYQKYREEPHILMRMSRERDVFERINPESQLKEAVSQTQKRGNRVF